MLRQRRARGVGGDRVEPERDGDLELAVREEVVRAPVLVNLPVHRGGAAVEHLQPVNADVARAVARVLRDHRGERDERRRVSRPAGLDREPAEIDLVTGEHDLLHRAAADALRLRIGDRLELAQAANLLGEPLRRLHLEHVAEPPPRLVQALDPERETHPPLGPELVDQQRMAGLRVLEEQRGPAGLDDAIRDLGDLEVRVDLGRDADELALALEKRDPVAEIASHPDQSRVERAYCTPSSSVSVRPRARPASNSSP